MQRWLACVPLCFGLVKWFQFGELKMLNFLCCFWEEDGLNKLLSFYNYDQQLRKLFFKTIYYILFFFSRTCDISIKIIVF